MDKDNNAPDFLVKGKELLDRRNEIGEEEHEKELNGEKIVWEKGSAYNPYEAELEEKYGLKEKD